MRIVEIPSENANSKQRPRMRRVYKTTEAVYKGPPDSFSYDGFRALGIAQLTLGALLCIIGLVQATLSYDDRAIVLVSGAVVIWCPLFAIAAGVVGMLFSKRRYWEVECMKLGFIITSSIAALLIVVMITVVIFVQFYYYDIINLEPSDSFKWLEKRNIDGDDIDGYKTMVILIVVLGVIEFIVAVISASIGCCLADTYEPDSKMERKQVKSQSQLGLVDPPIRVQQPPRSQMRYMDEPHIQYVQPPPMQYMQEPMQFVQEPVQYVQEPVQFMAPPQPLQFVQSHAMGSPPPSLLYMV